MYKSLDEKRAPLKTPAWEAILVPEPVPEH